MTRWVFFCLALAMSVALLGCTSNGDATGQPNDQSPQANRPVAKPTNLLVEPNDAITIGYDVHWATSIAVPERENLAHAVVLDDLLITVEHPSNKLTAVRMSDGEQLWHKKMPEHFGLIREPARLENTIIVNTPSTIFLLNAADGETRGQSSLRSPVGHGPVIVGNIAVFGGSDGMVFGHGILTGYSKWAYKMPSQILVPAQANGANVFVATQSGRYMSIQGETGEKRWDGRTFGAISATPAVTNVGTFVASEDHSLYALSSDGRDLWIFRYTAPLKQGPKVIRNIVYQPLPEGQVVALRATDGSELIRIDTSDDLVTQDRSGLVFQGDRKLVIRSPSTGRVIDEVKTKPLQTVLPTDDQGLLLISPRGKMIKLGPSATAAGR